MRWIWHERAGGDAPLKALKMEGALCTGMQVVSMAWEWSLGNNQKGKGDSGLHPKGTEFSPKLKYAWKQILPQCLQERMQFGQHMISTFLTLSGELTYAIHGFLTSRKYEIIKWILFEAAKFVAIHYTAIESYYQFPSSLLYFLTWKVKRANIRRNTILGGVI